LLSCTPSSSRFHLTPQKYTSPPVPPPFCMLLRKYLEGAKVSEFKQQVWERVMEICFERRVDRHRLIVEIMGHRSNVILVDDDHKIKGALRTMPPKIGNRRVIMPGVNYLPPPIPEKILLPGLDRKAFMEKASSMMKKGLPLKKALLDSFHGISPLWAEEIEHAARVEIEAGDTAGTLDRMWKALQAIMERYDREDFQPVVIEQEGGRTVFAAFEPDVYKSCPRKQYDNANHLLADHCARKQIVEQREQLRKQLQLVAEKELKKTELKEKRQKEDLLRAGKAEQYRLHGELILAHLHTIKEKCSSVELPDIYDPGPEPERIHIVLDPRYSAAENAQQFFKKYRKLLKSESIIGNRLSGTGAEKKYLENVLFSLEKADMPLLKEIKEELIQNRYIRKRSPSPAKEQPAKTGPLSFLSSSGFRIFVGQNNFQNEELTFKKSSRDDIWLHARDLPGAHVVIKNSPFPPGEQTLLEAAALAAFFSKGNMLPTVTVDYTRIKNVKRAPGKRPGMAIYNNFKSIAVSPEHPAVQRFKLVKKEE
ncbi:MAG: fibronectin/fibrinogen-binding protein, partial [Firmicutes bacterium]|nr:fibronectin/fibrinogen-binding protein [Bacillota bacterium]